MALSWVNGQAGSLLSIEDRGLAYGDGLFETMRIQSGRIPLLDSHLKRLSHGLSVLQFSGVSGLLKRVESDIQSALQEFASSHDNEVAILKLIVTRGQQGRGYLPSPQVAANVILQINSFPQFAHSTSGLVVKLSQYRLSNNSALAGLKHLNRLEQVLAAIELGHCRNEADDLLLMDQQEHIIESTKANLIYFFGQKPYTPDLSESGVQGVMLSFLQSCFPGISTRPLHVSELDLLDAAALVNSVFGVTPVARIEGINLQSEALVRPLTDQIEKMLGFCDG